MDKIFVNKPGKSTLVTVAIPTGAFYEKPELKGISHFLEHMCFKGTPTRNQKQISSSIDNVGGVLNAFTSWELTAYWALVGNSYRNLAIDVITDIATRPTVPAKEVDKERDVIVQELKMYEDNASHHVWDIFHETLYKPNSGFHETIIGTRETLKNITQKELKKYQKATYDNPVLIVVGNVNNKVQLSNKKILNVAPSYVKEGYQEKLITRSNITQSNILIGNSVNLKQYTDTEKVFLLSLLSSIYGDMSGRLFDVIREKNHLVYRVHFNQDIYRNGSIQWNVSLGLDKKNIYKAQKLVIKELSRIASPKELDIAYNKSIGSIEMNLDNTKFIGHSIAERISRGVDWKEYFVNYKKMLRKMKGQVNPFIKSMDFKNHILVGVTPK